MKKRKICMQGMSMCIQLVLLGVLMGSVAWGADIGPDSFGYVGTDETPYGFEDISGTGAGVLGGADDDRVVVNVGFPFTFYGKSYTSVCVSTNGVLSFGGCNGTDFANQDITATVPSGDYATIAPLWFDLTFGAEGAGSVYYQTLGQEGSRRFVVQWQNAHVLNGSKGITFQAILWEGSGEIAFQYLDIDAGENGAASNGGVATVGIRDAGGQANGRVVQWSYRVPVLHSGGAIRFSTVPPPVLGCAADILAEATSAEGAGVSYPPVTVTGTPAAAINYSNPTGSVFPLGDTVVTVSASNAFGKTSTCSFKVTVRDTAAPVVTVPAPITVEASGADGARVTFTASAVDIVDGTDTVVCTPASGSVFPVGSTAVACRATDRAGNTGTGSFNVTVTQTAMDGRMFGMGYMDQARRHHHFAFRVSQVEERDFGRLEYWMTDRTRCPEPRHEYGRNGDRDGERDSDYGRERVRISGRFVATWITEVTFVDDPSWQPGRNGRGRQPVPDRVRFTGRGLWNGRPGYTFEATATDKGEPGTHRDTFSLVVKDSRGKVVASISGDLDGGNVQSFLLRRR
jgi:hypothetical protein